MNFDEISEKAYKKQDLGEHKNIAEQLAYFKMIKLYQDFDNELIDKDKAKEQKNKIQKEYEWNLEKINKYYEIFEIQNNIRGKYQSYINEIEKSQELDNLLINSLKFIEIIIQDNNFFERNYKKIKNN